MTAPCRVNVNNIHIRKPSHIFVKPGAASAPRFILGCPKDLKEGSVGDLPVFASPDLFADLLTPSGDRSKSRDRADKSAPRPPAVLRPTLAACGALYRRARTATP